MYFSNSTKPTKMNADEKMNADDLKYILAEEGRYGISQNYEDNDIMNEGCSAIDIEEMMWDNYRWNLPQWLDDPNLRSSTTSLSLTCPMSSSCLCPGHDFDDNEPPTKAVANDLCFGDYETPDDAKTCGGENYHINKLKTKRPSPKSERRRLREKRVKDLRVMESRCHKKNVAHEL